ncbi:hypothetical protein B6U98_05885 [Thermoplasmatales archaeon ex4572_165]|nr:MAG: hypothetical protein B6U98_05885 [Thermoplasmatales archaeon ex4572_165]
MELKFNKDKITKISSEINNALIRLHELSELGKKNFLSDLHKIGSAKYFLIVAIEGSIDICNHLISINKFRAPDDYADSFRILGEIGVISEDFVKKLIEMARFRNRLVHIYWDLDDSLIYNIICEDVGDIERFIDTIASFLSKK